MFWINNSGMNVNFTRSVDSISIYWTDKVAGTVNKVGLNGGTVTTLVTGLNNPYDVVADSTSVYWTEANSVKRLIK